MITIGDLKRLLLRNGFQLKKKGRGLYEATHPLMKSLRVFLEGRLDSPAQSSEIEAVFHVLIEVAPTVHLPQPPMLGMNKERRGVNHMAGAAAVLLVATSIAFNVRFILVTRHGAPTPAVLERAETPDAVPPPNASVPQSTQENQPIAGASETYVDIQGGWRMESSCSQAPMEPMAGVSEKSKEDVKELQRKNTQQLHALHSRCCEGGR